jgi:hypothetical protein
MDAEMSTATSAHGSTLKQSSAFARRRGSHDLEATAVGFEERHVLLELLPPDIDGMSVRHARKPVFGLTRTQMFLSIGGASVNPAPIGICSRITRIVEHSKGG